MFTQETLLRIAGVLQLGILIASALVPSVLKWRTALQGLDRLLRQVIWVHGAFIVLTIIGFAVISIAEASSLAEGSRLARSMCGLMGIFWLARLAVQFFYFDASEHLNNWVLRLGYYALSATFVYLSVVYLWAAIG